MAQEQGEYRVGRGKPPLHTRFRKGRSGNPKGPRKKDLPALLLAALNEPVTVDKDGRRRRISKREAIVAGLVDKSADADLRATKMLIDMLEGHRKEGGAAARCGGGDAAAPAAAERSAIGSHKPRENRRRLDAARPP